jgi:site-specific DNA-cytosine methylase
MVVQPFEVGNCLTARMHKGINSTLDEGQTPVLQPIPLDMRNAGRDPEKHDEMNRQGVGVGEPGDPAHTVTSAFVHAVAQPISIHPHCIGRAPQAGPQGKEYLLDGSAYCMDSRGQPQAIAFHPTQDPISSTDGSTHAMGTGSAGGCATVAVAQLINIYGGNKRPDRPEGGFYVRMDEVTTKTLDAATGLNPTCSQGGTAVAQPIGWSEELTASIDLAGTIQRGGDGGRHDGVMTTSMAVRRLTPVECERLQGFPDNYTNIPWRKKDESPDGPRYKALGNSWAVPNVRWIGERIAKAA